MERRGRSHQASERRVRLSPPSPQDNVSGRFCHLKAQPELAHDQKLNLDQRRQRGKQEEPICVVSL